MESDGEITTVEEEGDKTAETKETAEGNVRSTKQSAGQASTWKHISKHKIRDTTLILLMAKTIP